MIYIVYTEWPNTKHNHAGMAYLAKELSKRNDKIHSTKLPFWPYKGNIILIRLRILYVCIKLAIMLRKGDKIFLMEYLEPYSGQHIIAKFIKLFKKNIQIVGLAHLAGGHLIEIHKDEKRISAQIALVDKVLVFGSSLKLFLEKLCDDPQKVITTYHYVDNDYYYPMLPKKDTDKIRVLFMGNLKRDFQLLVNIVSKTPFVEYDILMGNSKITEDLKNLPNVNLYPFLEEYEVRSLMQNADVSLSPMLDTVGSNVIVTSMAVGMVMVVSDVGSIRDYVDDTNAFLCKGEKEFIDAINNIYINRSTIKRMRNSSLRKAERISLNNFNNWITSFFNTI